MLEALRDGEDIAAARVVIEKALAGDAVAARFVVSLVSPKPRGRVIHLEMPEDDDCNVVTAFNVTLRAMCQGEITPDEALTVARFLDGRRKTLQAWQLEEKLTSYGRTIPGDPEWAPDADDDDEEDDDDAEEDEMTEAEAIAAAVSEMSLQENPARSEPPVAVADAMAQSGAASLQSPCISGSPAAPADPLAALGGFDAALVASVVRRLRAEIAAP
jgi:hypothetical protein